MTLAQSIRHSKASREVVNEKKEGSDFDDTYRMLGGDWHEVPDKEDRSQKPEVRRQKAEGRRQKSEGRSPKSGVGSQESQARPCHSDPALREKNLSSRSRLQPTAGILRCHKDARSALECGSASYRLVFAEWKAAAPLRFAAALQGAFGTIIFMPAAHAGGTQKP
jgi:hypothetical protein